MRQGKITASAFIIIVLLTALSGCVTPPAQPYIDFTATASSQYVWTLQANLSIPASVLGQTGLVTAATLTCYSNITYMNPLPSWQWVEQWQIDMLSSGLCPLKTTSVPPRQAGQWFQILDRSIDIQAIYFAVGGTGTGIPLGTNAGFVISLTIMAIPSRNNMTVTGSTSPSLPTS
jgi:hypothetical protein